MTPPGASDGGGESRDTELDARFAEIIAHWDDEAPGRPDPLAELTSPADDAPPTADGVFVADPPAEGTGGDVRDERYLVEPPEEPPPDPPEAVTDPPSAWRAATGAVDEDEEHYVPPPPAPLPAGDLQFWGILVGLVGGPLLLLYLMLFGRDAGALWTAFAIVLTVGGFGLLVSRLPAHRGDDGDDGARL